MVPPALAGLTLKVTVSVLQGEVKVQYRVANNGQSAIGLFNRLTSTGPDGSVHPDPQAVTIELQESVLHLRKMVLPVPTGLQVAERVVPLVCRVEPGRDLQETLSLRIPVQVNHPYQHALLLARAPSHHRVSASRAAKAARIQVSVGSFRLDDKMRLISVENDAHRVVPPGLAVAGQVVLGGGVDLPHPLDVLDFEVVSDP